MTSCAVLWFILNYILTKYDEVRRPVIYILYICVIKCMCIRTLSHLSRKVLRYPNNDYNNTIYIFISYNTTIFSKIKRIRVCKIRLLTNYSVYYKLNGIIHNLILNLLLQYKWIIMTLQYHFNCLYIYIYILVLLQVYVINV